jgi:hypothetical protein
MRRAATLALVLALLVMLMPTEPANASTRRLCARVGVLRDSPPPHGLIIARLRRPHRFRYIRRSANRRWALVRAQTGTVGWIGARSLCRA